MLRRNQGSLDHALALAGPYYRLVGNTVGNGRWFDSYLCGIVPSDYLPPGRPAGDRMHAAEAAGGPLMTAPPRGRAPADRPRRWRRARRRRWSC